MAINLTHANWLYARRTTPTQVKLELELRRLEGDAVLLALRAVSGPGASQEIQIELDSHDQATIIKWLKGSDEHATANQKQ